jgi:hypothetical protein
MGFQKQKIPVINVGRYAGTPIDQLPNSYLRWMVNQDFPKEWLEIADRKLKGSNKSSGGFIEVSRHALDKYSFLFIEKWINSLDGLTTKQETLDKGVGFASFVANQAQEAWEKGRDVSKHRHQHDGTTKVLDDIKWVFNANPKYPEYIDVITVMEIER